jgi:hypothetical protein
MRSSNLLYLIAGGALVLAIGGGIWLYQDSQRSGVEISVGRGGVSIQER